MEKGQYSGPVVWSGLDTENTENTDQNRGGHTEFVLSVSQAIVLFKRSGIMFQGKHSDLTERILAAYHKVYAKLGYGFREKVYRNALRLELKRSGLEVEVHKPIKVYYDGVVVGSYFADLVVNGLVILELKAVKMLLDRHEAQTLNYLKATNVEVALLLNFGPQPEFKRKVYDNDREGSLSWLPPEST